MENIQVLRTQLGAFQLINDELNKLRSLDRGEIPRGADGSLLNRCWQQQVENFFDETSMVRLYKQPRADVEDVLQTQQDCLVFVDANTFDCVFTARVLQRLPIVHAKLKEWTDKQWSRYHATLIAPTVENVILLEITDLFFQRGQDFANRTIHDEAMTGFVLYDVAENVWFVEAESTWHAVGGEYNKVLQL